MADDPAIQTDEVFVAAYEELRRLAHGLKRGTDSPTLNATALVHEAYIKLIGAGRFRAQSPEHLKHTLARAMRYVLLDAARRKAAAARGGGPAPMRRVPFDDPAAQSAIDPDDVLAVSAALDALAAQSEPQARAFELQFFGGLQVAEIAAIMQVSEKKVQRLLRIARASLALELSKDRDEPEGGR